MKRDAETSLNARQREAVEYNEGPLLIIAGAGTGKTTVIVEKIKYLIQKKLAKPEEILALTFTEKAAFEMEERVDKALPYGYTQMWIMTFHSFADRILRNEGFHIGLDPAYHLMTESESVRFLRQHIFEMGLIYFKPLGNPTKFTSGLIGHFSRLADEDVTPEEYLKWVKHTKFETPEDKTKNDELAIAYKKYEELKIKESSMDFANLISSSLKLLRTRPNILEQYRKQFKYILVDEFQDTNISQNELVKLLAGSAGHLTVVADDDQSIYKWRGAAISNVIQFRANYPKIKIVSLTQNYRSTQSILDHAYKLIQHNNPDRLEVKEKIDKHLTSIKKKPGKAPEFIYTNRVENEADAVAKKIIELVETEEYQFNDFAILVRANAHSEPFTRALSRHNIPYQFLGPGKLFKQPEIKELIAYLKFLCNIEDSTALYKVITMEDFNVSSRDIAGMMAYSKKLNKTLFETLENIDDVFVTPTTKEQVKKFVEMVYRHLKIVPKESAGQILYYFLEDSGLLQKLLSPESSPYQKRVQNLARFFDKLKSYEADHEDSSVFAVTDWIDLAIELGESPAAGDFDWSKENAVNILTVHASKGLEFPVVFVVNLVSNRFPTTERHEQIPIPEALIKEILPSGNYHEQEERRLFYVALTRAKDRLFLTAANYYGEGKREKKISSFVPETLGTEVLQQTKPDVDQLSILDFAPTPKQTQNAELTPQKLQSISYLSYSQIDTFQMCPLHYKLKYIFKIPTAPTASLTFGTTLHETLRQFTEMLMKKQIPSDPKKILFELYIRNWSSIGYVSKSHEESMRKRGESYLIEYLKSDLNKYDSPPLAIEQPFIFPLTSDLKLGGKIDRIDLTQDGIEIIDYKTTDYSSKRLPSERELRLNLQLSMYALAAQKIQSDIFTKHKGNVTLSLYLFDKGTKVSTSRTVEELQKATDDILKVKQSIEISEFNCSKNPLCMNCEYKLYCETS